MVSEVYGRLKAALPAGFPLYLGARHLREHAAPPRVVLVPDVDRFEAAQPWRGSSGAVLAAVRDRWIGLRVHIWGGTYDDVEGTLHELIPVLSDRYGANLRLGNGAWVDSEQDAWLHMGVAYVLPIAVRTPIVRPETYATLERIVQECKIG